MSAGRKAAGALEAGLRLLSHRSRSRHELSGLLSRKGFPEREVAAALDRLSELGYLDDARFARYRAHALLREGRLGPVAVARRLAAHGLTEAQIRAALEESAAELRFDPLSAARAVLERRGLFGKLDAKSRAKAARLLLARGFGEEVVERLLAGAALDSPEGEG
ncbi:MAG: regulatory protein RecX [Myxococcales bacterium]|nr:regulatory protein RecX [Myxococcales bacterium]